MSLNHKKKTSLLCLTLHECKNSELLEHSTSLSQQCPAVTCLSALTFRAVLNIAVLASALMTVLGQALLIF